MANWVDADALVILIRQACLEHPELRKSKYSNHPSAYAGFCYIASEAYYHLVGGPESQWRPAVIQCDSEDEKGGKKPDTHWFLYNAQGHIDHWHTLDKLPEDRVQGWPDADVTLYILDLTADQFEKDVISYENFSLCGFLTKQPSKRAQVLMDWVLKEI